MSIKSAIIAQFRRPTGLLGSLAGWLMATRPSNQLRNARTVELLKLNADSRVLEIGCGPGLALAQCAQIITAGRVVGLDHSATMISQAGQRIRASGAKSPVELIEGGVERLQDWPASFDRVFSLNVIQFQSDKLAFYRAVFTALAPGGACLTTFQPRLSKDARTTAQTMINAIKDGLSKAGFQTISQVELIGGDTPATCVIGHKPET